MHNRMIIISNLLNKHEMLFLVFGYLCYQCSIGVMMSQECVTLNAWYTIADASKNEDSNLKISFLKIINVNVCIAFHVAIATLNFSWQLL